MIVIRKTFSVNRVLSFELVPVPLRVLWTETVSRKSPPKLEYSHKWSVPRAFGQPRANGHNGTAKFRWQESAAS